MAQYVCSVCGYIHDEAKAGKWEDLPADWKCPLCGAGKDAFKKKEESVKAETLREGEARLARSDLKNRRAYPARHANAVTGGNELPKPHVDKELSAMEMSIICSNLARGCEKQYLPAEAESFKRLADFFKSKATPVENANTEAILALIEKDLSVGYPYGNAVAGKSADRGALRCQVWSEKVTRMLQSLLTRYQAEGEKMLENTGVWVCTVCGFTYVGDAAPELCPVCKVPAWKFEKVEGRAR